MTQAELLRLYNHYVNTSKTHPNKITKEKAAINAAQILENSPCIFPKEAEPATPKEVKKVK